MRLVGLACRDFAMHASLDLDLSGVSELVVVGENGHGKSRLLDAVLWSVYGRPARGSTDRLIRRGASSMTARTTWLRGSEEVVIARTRSVATKAGASSLTLTVDGVDRTKHTIGETQEEIVRLFGPLETLWAGPLMAQGESDALMRADPASRKQVLGKLFGLERFERYHEAAKDLLAAAVMERQIAQNRLAEAEAVIASSTTVRADLAQTDSAVAGGVSVIARQEERVVALREKAVQMKERADRIVALTDQIDRLNAALDMHASRRASLDGQLTEARNRASGGPVVKPTEAPTDEAMVNARLLVAEERTLRSDRAVVVAKLGQLREATAKADRDGLCDRCPYRVSSDEQPQLEGVIASIDARLATVGDAAAALAALEQQANDARAWAAHVQRTSDAETMVHGLEAMLADLDRADVAANADVAALNAERTRLMQTIAGSDGLAEELREASEHLQQMKATQDDLRQQQARLVAALDRLVSAEDRVVEAGTEIRRLVTREAAAMLVAKAFHRDGVPMLILEQGIPQIEARANAILDRMPGDLRLSLVTQRESKSGSVRDTLDVVVQTETVDCDYDLLSGAERFRVDFALRLGLADVLSHRAGTSFETLWLDEPFSAQSPRALETLLECLSAVADDFGLMVVVTHQPEVADRFPVRLSVSKVDGIATVEVAA